MKKKKSATTVLLLVILAAGLSLLLYPSVSNYWNSKHQTVEIKNYVEAIAAIDEEEYGRLYEKAVEYNRSASKRGNVFVLNDEDKEEYLELLNVAGTGVMGYIDIPSIEVTLPIYHGTDDSVLQIGVGHLEWTSLPVGGESTHCVLSGHRGLPSSKLFTDLDKVVEGDVFMIQVLNEVMTYEVDKILIVEPEDTEALMRVEGKDYCTLVTCTPYGINSHRLLIRGHRIENAASAASVRITADAVQVEEMIIAPALAIPMLIVIVFVLIFGSKGRKDRPDDL